MPITDTTMSDEWTTTPQAPKPIFDESEYIYTGITSAEQVQQATVRDLTHYTGDPDKMFDTQTFFPAPEPPPPIPVPPQPVSAALVPAEPVPVVTTDPWHAPWCGPCSPEMATAIKELLAGGVEFEQPEDAEGAKYPLMRLEPLQSLVWQCASMAAARILHNRVNVYINRVTKRSGRHFKTMKHIHGPDMISLEVSRII